MCLKFKETIMKSYSKNPSQKVASITPEQRHLSAELIADEIIDNATDTHALLDEVDLIDVESTDYKNLVTTKRPSVGLTGEQNGVTAVPQMGEDQRYATVESLFGKVYAQTLMTDEVIHDSKINLKDETARLTGEDFLDMLINELLFGDESKFDGIQRLRGILETRIDKGNSFSQGLKTDADRHSDYYQVLKTGVEGSFGGTDKAIKAYFSKLKKSLPSKYRRKAKWYMNADVFEALEQVEINGNPLIKWGRSAYSKEEGFIMLGHLIVIIDQMNGEGANETPVMFGDLRSAIKVLDLRGEGSHFTVDKTSVKGASIVYVDSRYGEIMQANDALRVSLQAA